MPLNDVERDQMVRTIWGELAPGASGSVDQNQAAAIAHVILNRRDFGAPYPDNIRGVVSQSGAFPSWDNPNLPNHPSRLSQSADAYQQIGKVVDGVADGSIPDPTQGFTHFTRQDAPQSTKKVGSLTFYPDPQSRTSAAPTGDSGTLPPGTSSDDAILSRYAQKGGAAPAAASGAVTDDEALLSRYSRVSPVSPAGRVAMGFPASSSTVVASAGDTPLSTRTPPPPAPTMGEFFSKTPSDQQIRKLLLLSTPLAGPIAGQGAGAASRGISGLLQVPGVAKVLNLAGLTEAVRGGSDVMYAVNKLRDLLGGD